MINLKPIKVCPVWLQLLWLQFEVVRGPVGVDGGRFGTARGQKCPRPAPKSTPTGPRTTSNCSHMSCGRIHRSPICRIVLYSLYIAMVGLLWVALSVPFCLQMFSVQVRLTSWRGCIVVQRVHCRSQCGCLVLFRLHSGPLFGDLWSWLQLVWVHFEVVRGPAGGSLGSKWDGFGAKEPPTGPKSIPPGLRTTSNCSHMHCSHIHRPPIGRIWSYSPYCFDRAHEVQPHP